MYVINFIRAVRTTTEIVIGNDLIIDSLFNTAAINCTVQCHNRVPRRCNISCLFPFLFRRVRQRWNRFLLPADVVFINRVAIESRLRHDCSNYTSRSHAKGRQCLKENRSMMCLVKPVSHGITKCLNRNAVVGKGTSYLNGTFHTNAIESLVKKEHSSDAQLCWGSLTPYYKMFFH